MRRRLFGANRPGVRARPRPHRPRLEGLEDRRLLATYVVDFAPGGLTLADAIDQANKNAGPDLITFNISGTGVHTVATDSLPPITDPVTIDGTTQQGYQGSPLLELDGRGVGGIGIQISASNTAIKGLAIFNYTSHGIRVSANNVVISGNYIGTNAAGANNVPNGGDGIALRGASGTVIGGSGATSRNVISGNTGAGISIDSASSSNTILGNYIGTTAGGDGALGNVGVGILVNGGSNLIGGSQPDEGNVISGNQGNGIQIAGVNAQRNRVLGNRIGLAQAGDSAVGNQADGILVQNAANNTIGGVTAGSGNLIGGNTNNGVELILAANTLIQGNTIGTNGGGTLDLGNGAAGILVNGGNGTKIGGTLANTGNIIAFNGRTTPSAGVTILSGDNIPILSNSIYGNTALGIDLGGNGVTPNDPGDPDTGPNNLQNYPVLSNVATASGRTLVQGTLNSRPSQTYLIQFFVQDDLDPSGFGQGKTLIGSTLLTTDPDGDASINALLDAPTSVGQFITATATATSDVGMTGETSEFSEGLQLAAARLADLSLSIQDAPDPVVLNGQLTYTITVTNRGPDTATDVQYSQVLPAGATLNNVSSTQGNVTTGGAGLVGDLGDIPSGQSVTISVVILPHSTGTISTTASVVSGEIDTNAANNTATETTRVEVPVDVEVTLHPEPSPGIAGHRLDFVALVTNKGPGFATNVQLTADLPPNVVYIGTFAGQGPPAELVGNTVTVNLGSISVASTIAVRIAVMPLTTGPITQTVTVTTDALDTNQPNNKATTTAQVLPGADLSARIEATESALATGQTGTYTVTVTNNGPEPTTNAVLNVQPMPGLVLLGGGVSSTGSVVTLQPDGTVQTTFASIAAGQSVTLTLQAQPVADFLGYSGLAAYITSGETGDPDPSNNVATIVTTINSADIGVSQTALPNPARVNEELTFQLTVTNHGPATARQVQVVDALPPNVELLRVDTSGALTQNPSGGSIQVDFDSIPSGASQTINVVVRPLTTEPLVNHVSVSGAGIDPNTENNWSAFDVVVSPADLAVSLQTSAATLLAGDVLTYTATVVNNGPTDVTSNVTLVSALPSGVMIQDVSTSQGTISAGNGNVVAQLGPLGVGGQAIVTIRVIPTAAGPLTNTVTVSSSQPDVDPSNNSASATVRVTNAPGQVDFSQDLYVVSEDAGQAVITLVRNQGTEGEVSVHYALEDGSAVAGRDYEAVSGVVTFADGQTTASFNVPVLHNGLATGTLGATILLSDPAGGATLGPRATATLGILDIDVDTTPPAVTNVTLLGPPNAITGVVLTFSEYIDPSRVAIPGNFQLLSPRGRPIPMAAPAYDAINHAVILRPDVPLRGPGFSRVIVNGQGPNGVTDLSGNLLDGNGDGLAGGDFLASFARGNRLSYQDVDGDLVSLNISNGGSLDLVRGADGSSNVLRVFGSLSRRTTLTGGVRRNPRGGDGMANLGRIEGIHFGQIRSRLTTPPLYVTAQVDAIAEALFLHPTPPPQGTLALRLAVRRARFA